MIVFDKDHYMGVYIHSAVMHCRRTEKENLPTEQITFFLKNVDLYQYY